MIRFSTTIILSLLIFAALLTLIGSSSASFDPCISTIKTDKQKFSINEPILISYSIKNVSKDTVDIWHCNFWCNNKIVVTNDSSIEVSRTDWGKRTIAAFSPGGNRDKNFPVALAPNEIDSTYEKYNLKDHFIFNKKGTYTVTYFYHEIDEKSEIKIASNPLSIYINN
jgi:hypothetical protein